MTDVPHFSLPFRFAPQGSAIVNEQDAVEEIADCVLAILSCPRGQRTELPEFGWDDPTFTHVDLNELRTAVEEWEPRATLLLDQQLDALDVLVRRVQVSVGVRTEE